jgi:hypothetical protein
MMWFRVVVSGGGGGGGGGSTSIKEKSNIIVHNFSIITDASC